MPSVIDGTDNFSTDTDLVALIGADLTAVGIVGTNPYASLCKRDGSIVGGSDNGKFIKWANGELECYGRAITNTTATSLNTFPMVFNVSPIIVGTTDYSSSNYIHNAKVSFVTVNTFNAVIVTKSPNTTSTSLNGGGFMYVAKGKWK